MPELPEMETYRLLLHERITGRSVTGAEVEREKTINLPVPAFREAVTGSSILAVERRAKHLLFRLSTGQVLLLHLMLGGFLYCGTAADRLDRTAQVTLSFGEDKLYFHGLRLGYLHLLTEQQAEMELADLGPEPLAPSYSLQTFQDHLRNKRSVLKTALVDQTFLAGIGNCYADELCFHAGLLPTRRIPTLSEADGERLYHSMRTVLQEAIRYGGYMEQPLYQGDTLTGGYNNRCLVYDRGGQPCVRCSRPIIQSELSSRKVFYCGHCQH